MKKIRPIFLAVWCDFKPSSLVIMLQTPGKQNMKMTENILSLIRRYKNSSFISVLNFLEFSFVSYLQLVEVQRELIGLDIRGKVFTGFDIRSFLLIFVKIVSVRMLCEVDMGMFVKSCVMPVLFAVLEFSRKRCGFRL